jgi:hypothetical protein
MSGSLIKLDEVVASSSATVTLGVSNWDTSYDVYKVIVTDVIPTEDSRNLYFRVVKSGSADDSSNYDYSYFAMRTDTTFGSIGNTNQTFWQTSNYSNGTATGETMNGVFYLFNFNGTEYSYVTNETASRTSSSTLISAQGGGVHTVGSASNGVQFFYSSGNIASGTFTLYGLKK